MLRDEQYDHSSDLPLPSLDEGEEVTEPDLAHGVHLRDAYIAQQLAKTKAAYARPSREQLDAWKSADLQQAANPRSAPPRPTVPEPKRLSNKPPPVWSAGRAQWTPSHLYGKNAMPWLYDRTKAKPAADWIMCFRSRG
jgi:hypothetical protein